MIRQCSALQLGTMVLSLAFCQLVFAAQPTNNIPEDVEQAKRKGLSDIHIPEPKINRPVASSIDRILRVDSVVLAKLVDKESTYADNNKTSIVTWLRFDTIEHVSGPLFRNLPPPSGAPAKLTRNFNPGSSFLVRVFGGTLYQDGVKVVGDSPFAEMPVHKQYVLFAFFDSDAQEALAGFNFGPERVIRVEDDGSLHTLRGSSFHAINTFLASQQLHDLNSLKTALRDRSRSLGR